MSVVPMRRRQPTSKDRLAPCECCGYPLSERHHLLAFRDFGETGDEWTRALCANCHALCHLIEQAALADDDKWQGDPRSTLIALIHGHGRVCTVTGDIRQILAFVWDAKRIETDAFRARCDLLRKTAERRQNGDRLLSKMCEARTSQLQSQQVADFAERILRRWDALASAAKGA
jgi:hypothetical protein